MTEREYQNARLMFAGVLIARISAVGFGVKAALSGDWYGVALMGIIFAGLYLALPSKTE